MSTSVTINAKNLAGEPLSDARWIISKHPMGGFVTPPSVLVSDVVASGNLDALGNVVVQNVAVSARGDYYSLEIVGQGRWNFRVDSTVINVARWVASNPDPARGVE